MKIMLAASVAALSIGQASAQGVTTPPSPSASVAPAATPAPKPPFEPIRTKRPVSPHVARVANANRDATYQPQSQAFVNAVQVFPYSDGAIYQVYTAPGAVTDIVLQPGENLVAVAAGDTVRWVIGDTTSGSGTEKRTHILVKPFASGLATNLVVTTDRRSYHLQLTATSRTAMAALSWTYPADQLIALRRVGRILQEQGRPQLKSFNGAGWGTPQSPYCRGFSPEEFQALDFSRMDLSEYYADIEARTQSDIKINMEERVDAYLKAVGQ